MFQANVWQQPLDSMMPHTQLPRRACPHLVATLPAAFVGAGRAGGAAGLAALAVGALHCAALGAGRAGLPSVARGAALVPAEQVAPAALAAGTVLQLVTRWQRAEGLSGTAVAHSQAAVVSRQLRFLLPQRLAEAQLSLHCAAEALAAGGGAGVAARQLAAAQRRALPGRILRERLWGGGRVLAC